MSPTGWYGFNKQVILDNPLLCSCQAGCGEVMASLQSFSLFCWGFPELSCLLQISPEKRWVESKEVCVKQSWIMAQAPQEPAEVRDSQVRVGVGGRES